MKSIILTAMLVFGSQTANAQDVLVDARDLREAVNDSYQLERTTSDAASSTYGLAADIDAVNPQVNSAQQGTMRIINHYKNKWRVNSAVVGALNEIEQALKSGLDDVRRDVSQLGRNASRAQNSIADAGEDAARLSRLLDRIDRGARDPHRCPRRDRGPFGRH